MWITSFMSVYKEEWNMKFRRLFSESFICSKPEFISGISLLMILVFFTTRPDHIFAINRDGIEVLTLSDMLVLALKHNPEIVKGAQTININRAEEIIGSQYPYNPELEFEVSSDSVLANEGEGSFLIGISQQIETGSKRRLRKRIAEYGTKGAILDLEDKKRVIRFSVKSLFGKLILLKEKSKFIDEIIDIDKRLVEVTKAKIEVGDTPEMNLGIALSERDRAENEKLLILSEISAIKRELNLIIGREIESDFIAEGDLSIKKTDYIDIQRLIDNVYKNRADIKSLEIKKKKKEKVLLLIKKMNIPDIRLSLFYEEDKSIIEGLNRDEITDKGKILGSSFSIDLPIVNRRKGEIIKIEEEKRLIEIELLNLKRKLKQRIIALYEGLKPIENALSRLKDKILSQERENIELIQSAYDLGQIEIGILLSAQERFINTNKDYLDLQFKQYITRSRLEEEIGIDLKGEDQ